MPSDNSKKPRTKVKAPRQPRVLDNVITPDYQTEYISQDPNLTSWDSLTYKTLNNRTEKAYSAVPKKRDTIFPQLGKRRYSPDVNVNWTWGSQIPDGSTGNTNKRKARTKQTRGGALVHVPKSSNTSTSRSSIIDDIESPTKLDVGRLGHYSDIRTRTEYTPLGNKAAWDQKLKNATAHKYSRLKYKWNKSKLKSNLDKFKTNPLGYIKKNPGKSLIAASLIGGTGYLAASMYGNHKKRKRDRDNLNNNRASTKIKNFLNRTI